MENKQIHRAVVIWTNACRFLLAVVFTFSGFIKANDPLGTVYKVQDYLEAWGLLSLKSGALPYVLALAVGVFEFALGIYLLFGIRRRLAPFLTLLVMCFMTPLTLWLAISNPISDCGCFGDAVVLTNWETFAKNVVLLIAAVSVFRGSRHLFKLVTDKVDWLVALYSFVFIIFFSTFTFRHLPVFDFRPYHIGSDIREKMEIPEGEKPSVLETVFIYAKEGKEQVFTIDNLPGDTTWAFVDSKTIVKEKGYEPPIQDFHIVSQEDGLELTDTILGDDNYTFLLVAPWLERADDSSMDLINEVYDYSVEHGYGFYALTSSPEDAIALWCDRTGAEYPFCQMDDITLKTIIRSNPGLLLIKDGTILNKWSDSQLPDEYVLTDSLDKLELGRQKYVNDWYTMGYVLLWFIVPLAFVIGADQLFVVRLQKKAERSKPQRDEEQQ